MYCGGSSFFKWCETFLYTPCSWLQILSFDDANHRFIVFSFKYCLSRMYAALKKSNSTSRLPLLKSKRSQAASHWGWGEQGYQDPVQPARYWVQRHALHIWLWPSGGRSTGLGAQSRNEAWRCRRPAEASKEGRGKNRNTGVQTQKCRKQEPWNSGTLEQ